MRMSSFIGGCVLGMVGAIYVMQQKPKAMQAVNQAMSKMGSNVMNKAVSKLNSRSSKMSAQPTSAQAQADSQSSSKSFGNHKVSESLIKGIIESDPALQAQVNEITKESSQLKH